MRYEFAKRDSRWGALKGALVLVDGELVGAIEPLYRSYESSRPYAYQAYVALENDALCDDEGAPTQHRTLAEAKAAVVALMARNGIDAA